MRLGQRERDILLAAAAHDALVLTEPGMSRSLSAARRRAALSLGKAGLVAPVVALASSRQKEAGSPAKTAPRATIALTPLGRYVMVAYGRYITAGKPVRWTRPARGAVLPGRDPADLIGETLALTQAALRDTLNDLKGVLIAAIGRPLKSPGLLDTVTRHLERKATLLKARSGAVPQPRGRAHRRASARPLERRHVRPISSSVETSGAAEGRAAAIHRMPLEFEDLEGRLSKGLSLS